MSSKVVLHIFSSNKQFPFRCAMSIKASWGCWRGYLASLHLVNKSQYLNILWGGVLIKMCYYFLKVLLFLLSWQQWFYFTDKSLWACCWHLHVICPLMIPFWLITTRTSRHRQFFMRDRIHCETLSALRACLSSPLPQVGADYPPVTRLCVHRGPQPPLCCGHCAET